MLLRSLGIILLASPLVCHTTARSFAISHESLWLLVSRQLHPTTIIRVLRYFSAQWETSIPHQSPRKAIYQRAFRVQGSRHISKAGMAAVLAVVEVRHLQLTLNVVQRSSLNWNTFSRVNIIRLHTTGLTMEDNDSICRRWPAPCRRVYRPAWISDHMATRTLRKVFPPRIHINISKQCMLDQSLTQLC